MSMPLNHQVLSKPSTAKRCGEILGSTSQSAASPSRKAEWISRVWRSSQPSISPPAFQCTGTRAGSSG